MTLAIIIPVNSPEDGKSRLKDVLPDADRIALNWRLLTHTLNVAAALKRHAHIHVVSRSAAVLADAARRGVGAIRESDDCEGLNAALGLATRAAAEGGATEAMVLPVDLPLLTPDSLYHAIETFNEEIDVAIVTDMRGMGTNLLMWRPIGAARFQYGPHSAGKHRRMAQAAGFRVRVRRDPILSFDLDTPDDLKTWRL